MAMEEGGVRITDHLRVTRDFIYHWLASKGLLIRRLERLGEEHWWE